MSFQEAETGFGDPFAWIYADPLHSSEERQEIVIGQSGTGRLMLVSVSRNVRARFGYSAHESLPEANAAKMKKNDRTADHDEMPAEYQLDHSKAKPNRFASRMPQGDVVGVVLEEDVAKVFDSSEAVNRFLRSAIEAMPGERGTARKRAEKKITAMRRKN